uniref:Uncharacterized protein n=1 Tax=Chromera velia CCMP2878 TaxID=1169474 RepID=A0A0G4HZ56_9ALVE|eukprot:Cvel_33852.t1-p1 / transcript=Cvel_33852.t1 / gene=Cvel_33852 / organism=Chromera_velia_CCMP2878 / gene_product=hypothetical protein / transcript_product=hypothetical protein / location=Cvel_scaffold5626:3101-3868(-) / protein_length=256 / sequence_SO=supercontig / SO=protein_coding / is_pseudo=false
MAVYYFLAGRRNNRDGRARGAAAVGVGLAAAATAVAAGAAALSSGNPTPTHMPPTRMTLQPAIQPTQGLQQALQSTPQRRSPFGSALWQPRYGPENVIKVLIHRRHMTTQTVRGERVHNAAVMILVGETPDICGRLGFFASTLNETNVDDRRAVRAYLTDVPPPVEWDLRRPTRSSYGIGTRYNKFWIFPANQFLECMQTQFPSAWPTQDALHTLSSAWTHELEVSLQNQGPTASEQMTVLMGVTAKRRVPGAGIC